MLHTLLYGGAWGNVRVASWGGSGQNAVFRASLQRGLDDDWNLEWVMAIFQRGYFDQALPIALTLLPDFLDLPPIAHLPR
jgi:hypothetical protein